MHTIGCAIKANVDVQKGLVRKRQKCIRIADYLQRLAEWDNI